MSTPTRVGLHGGTEGSVVLGVGVLLLARDGETANQAGGREGGAWRAVGVGASGRRWRLAAWRMSLDSLGMFKGRWPSRAQEAAGNAVRRGSRSAAPRGPWKSRNPRYILWVQGGRHPSVPAGWTILPCDQEWVVSVGRQEETTLAARPGHSEHQGAVPAPLRHDCLPVLV